MHVVKRAFTATVSHTSLNTAAVHNTTPLSGRPLSFHIRSSRQAAHWQQTTRAATRQMTNNTSSVNIETSMQPEGPAADHQAAPKLAKRKVALFVAYVGSSFRGEYCLYTDCATAKSRSTLPVLQDYNYKHKVLEALWRTSCSKLYLTWEEFCHPTTALSKKLAGLGAAGLTKGCMLWQT